MVHIDLFSGIGGFALAVDEVFGDCEHIFCEIDSYCSALLKKRFKGARIYGDIRTLSRERLTADSDSDRRIGRDAEIDTTQNGEQTFNDTQKCDGRAVADTLGSKCGGEDNGQLQNEGRFASKGRRKGLQPEDREARSDNAEQGDVVTPDTDSRRQEKQELQTTGDKQCDRGAIADTQSGQSGVEETGNRREDISRGSEECFILTGGFPCQPFSQAGKRKGTDDNRYLWPEMLRVIRDFKPTWVIAENVRGILTIEGGMVFEQVCLDLEGEGYEVQPLVIPAVAKNAPHRRDRVWFVANRTSEGGEGDGLQGSGRFGLGSGNREGEESQKFDVERWRENWLEVATELCGVDDGLPAELDGLKLSKSRHRVERLKALGNAIVPQVAIEIMRGIKFSESTNNQRRK